MNDLIIRFSKITDISFDSKLKISTGGTTEPSIAYDENLKRIKFNLAIKLHINYLCYILLGKDAK